MSFINFPATIPVFPTLPPLEYPVYKIPEFRTDVMIGITGREVQVAREVYPRFVFNLSFGNHSWLRDQTQNTSIYQPLSGFTELEQISGLFLQCLGSYGNFYYEDPDDNSRLAVPCGTTDGTTTTFQLYYSWGSGPFTPPLTFPVSGVKTLDAVYLDGTAQSSANYSLDSTNTKVVFNTAPTTGQALTVDLHFYFRCRFFNDVEEYDQWAKNMWQNKEVKFITVKP